MPTEAGTRRRQRGQILPIAALMMVALVAGTALVMEAGNAYAHQRVMQNGADSMANAGATVLAQRLGGANGSWTPAQWDQAVEDALDAMRDANDIDSYQAWYTDVAGKLLTADGAVTGSYNLAVPVGSDTLPLTTQGVRVTGSQSFGTTFARAIGLNAFTASADATAVTGMLTGGQFLPIVFPVTMADCDGSGSTVEVDAPWRLSNPGNPHPAGQEFIIPLCKSGTGSFMFLDLDTDSDVDCYDEVVNPPSIQFTQFPAFVKTDTGADCQTKVEDGIVDRSLQGKVVLIPICDTDCSTTGGTTGSYKIIRITAFFLDYLSYSNNQNNPACAYTSSPTYGTSLVNIVGGNGSSACIAGWFVRYVTSGPVGSGTIANGEAIGVQLIK